MSAVSAVLLILGMAVPVGAQVVLEGRVIDDFTEEPITGASVFLLDQHGQDMVQTLSNDTGRFRIVSTAGGRVAFRVSRIGYPFVTTPHFEVAENDTVSVEVRMRTDAIPLAPLEVVARRGDTRGPILSDFDYRRNRGFGFFITREEIERRNAMSLSDLLVAAPGVRVLPGGRGGGRRLTMARALTVGGACPVQIYLDGFLMNPRTPSFTQDERLEGELAFAFEPDQNFSVDEVVSPSVVEGIEIYQGLSSVPPEFLSPDARCGVVAIWTRRGPSG